ncbi:prepilin-type N-terminal cleavage/methylation domain-containing protein, partial [Vibrio parahaemolyticus]
MGFRACALRLGTPFMKRSSFRPIQGFTLIEMLVVVALL